MTLIYDTLQDYNAYFAPLKPRIRFKSLDGTDTYFTFNGHTSPKDINAIYCDVERAIGETGVFNIIIEDSANIVDKDKIRNMKVYIDFGKSSSTYKQFFVGFADVFNIRRPRSYYQEYLVSGPSTRIQAAELLLSRRQASDIQTVDDPTIVPDAKYNINNIFKDSLKKSGWRPLDKESIEDLTGWTDTSLISSDVNTNFPVINEPLTPAWDFWDRLCQVAGSVWDINYDTPDEEKPMLSYNPALHTGILLKSGDLKTDSDDADKTAYIKSSFEIDENASSDAGTATRLYATTIIDRQVVVSSDKATGATTLDNRALAQQIIIENDQRRITDFAFILSKVGEPESPKSRINGDFVMDSGDNKPTGRTLATFKIPLSSVESTPKTVFINDVDVKIRFLEGSNKVWLRLFQRSGIDGKAQSDPKNTIKWHHNNILNTTQTLYSAKAPGGDYDDRDKLAWTAVNTGPIYSYSVFSNIRRLQARTNMTAANRLRMKEAIVDASFLSEPRSVSAFLSINLSRRSKPRRGIADVVVTVPNNFLFQPYQWLSFNDGLSDVSQDLQIQRARIVASALPSDPQIGALDMSLTLSGLYNSLIGSCSCS